MNGVQNFSDLTIFQQIFAGIVCAVVVVLGLAGNYYQRKSKTNSLGGE